MRLGEGLITTQSPIQIHSGMTFKGIVIRGRQLKAGAPIKALKLYPGKCLDVHWDR